MFWWGCRRIHVPAFVERSAPARIGRPTRPSVAGIHVPAFVERSPTGTAKWTPTRVAGIHVPAFVERRPAGCGSRSRAHVSPDSRPGLR